MVEVIVLDEFTAWYRELPESTSDDVDVVVELLAVRGVALGDPYSSAIKGARIALRELKIQSGGDPIRVFYAFDPKRQAVLLIGGDKTGDGRFYERMIPLSEKLWSEYLESMT